MQESWFCSSYDLVSFGNGPKRLQSICTATALLQFHLIFIGCSNPLRHLLQTTTLEICTQSFSSSLSRHRFLLKVVQSQEHLSRKHSKLLKISVADILLVKMSFSTLLTCDINSYMSVEAGVSINLLLDCNERIAFNVVCKRMCAVLKTHLSVYRLQASLSFLIREIKVKKYENQTMHSPTISYLI
jgi:hypothetical protein